MAVHFIKPNAAFSDTGGCLALNDYTNLREGVANADSTPGLRTVTNDVGNTTLAVCSTTDNMPETPTSLNSVTFRARGRFQSWTDDISIYRAYANVPNYGSYQLSWAQNNYGSGAWGEQSVSLPTTLTLSELNGITFEFHQYQYGRQMGGDGVYFEMDCMEVEVNYETSAPRNVVQNPAQPGDLSTLVFTENQATVTTGSPRNVTGTTEVITLTENAATVQKNQKRTIGSSTGTIKRRKGLVYQVFDFDASNYLRTISGNSGANAYDADTGTYAETNWGGTNAVGAEFPIGRGMSAQIGPYDDASELPVRVEARFYVSNTVSGTGECTLYAYFGDDTDFNFSGDSTDEFFDTKGMHPVITHGSVGGSWSEWGEVKTGEYSWNDPHGNDFTTPLPWTSIKERLAFGFNRTSGTTGRVHAIQVRVTSAIACVRTGYFDASGTLDGGVTVVGNNWSTTANAYDGSTSTWATNGGGIENATLRIHGNTLTQGSASDEIFGVYVRAYCRHTWTGTDYSETNLKPTFHDLGDIDQIDKVEDYEAFVEQLGQNVCNVNVISNINIVEVPTSGSGFWTPWYRLKSDDPNFTPYINWTDLPKMSLAYYRSASYNHGATYTDVAKMEIAVLAAPENSVRAGGRAKKDRTLNCSPEVITLDGTNYPATVSRQRGVNQDNTNPGDLTTISFTEGTASISFSSPRDVVQDRESAGDLSSMEFTETASTVNATRDVTQNPAQPGDLTTISFTESAATVSFATHRTVTGLTEAITMPATASVNLARGVSSSPETLQLAEVASTVNASRIPLGVTEVLSSTSAGTNVDTARGVQSGTEALICTESSSTINRERGVVGTTEVILATESQASISTTANLDVTCTTEAITFTETPASVNGTRIAAGTVEITAFVENASAVNAERSVSATTETLALTDNDSTVAFGRIVAATTESISLVEGSSTVDRQRGVNAGTEALSLTESAANVNLSRVAQSATEVLTLADNDSVANRARNTIGVTESVTISENASVVDRQRGVNAGTEAVVMTESLSTVLRGANLDVVCTTEAIALAENAAAISADRAVNAATEVVSLDALASDTNFNRTVLTTSESVVMTESQATVDTAASNNPRNVTCTTEAVSFVETAANVNGLRIVGAGVELTALAEAAASINLTREVVSATEVLALIEASASVNSSRTVQSTTDQLVMAESAADVSTTTSRIVNAVTESLVTSSSATSNQTRGVLSSTEILGLAAQSSSIQVLRNVVATTEQLALAEAGAAVLTSRDVAGLTSPLLMTESAGQVFRGANLDVNAATSVMTLTEQAAAVAFPRNVSGLTEQLNLVAVPATLNRPWLVICASEELSFTEGLAKIDKTRTGAMPGSMVWVHPDIKPVWVSD